MATEPSTHATSPGEHTALPEGAASGGIPGDEATSVPPFLSAHEVHKCYGAGTRRVEALRGATLRIDEPGFYAIMGASGSGKSTLLHLLAGLDRPDAGTIHVNGRRVDTMRERELTLYRRRDIGVIFQQFNLLPTLTALDNVALPGLLDGRPATAMRQRAADLLTRFGLQARLDHRPDALSGGEQQRVAIARALLFEPRVLFADEPSGALDSENSERLWAMLGDLARERRMVVLMVTHEPAAAAHCRQVFVIRDGVVAGAFETKGMHASDLVVCAADIGRPAQ